MSMDGTAEFRKAVERFRRAWAAQLKQLAPRPIEILPETEAEIAEWARVYRGIGSSGICQACNQEFRNCRCGP